MTSAYEIFEQFSKLSIDFFNHFIELHISDNGQPLRRFWDVMRLYARNLVGDIKGASVSLPWGCFLDREVPGCREIWKFKKHFKKLNYYVKL